MIFADAAPWLVSMRDSALAVAAVCGAVLTIAAASKLPYVRGPILWIWKQFTEDGVAAYWRKHEDVAAKAVELRLVDFGRQIGDLGERISTHGEELHELRTEHQDEILDLRTRVERIESSCEALPGIEAATIAIAAHTDTDRRHDDT